jgi:sporulation protein YqfC
VLNNLSTYLNLEDYRISILNNGVHILNYKSIVDITETEIILKIDKKLIRIKGSSFRLKELDKKELLIHGKIKKVEINE